MKANNLIIDSISKTYKKGKIRANDNISLELYPSEITALIGHNGAGKTTLLNQIIGNAKPDSGDITYKGISLVKNSKVARELVSIMPQFHAPLEGVTLRQSIESILRIKGVSEKQVHLCTKQVLKDFEKQKFGEFNVIDVFDVKNTKSICRSAYAFCCSYTIAFFHTSSFS